MVEPLLERDLEEAILRELETFLLELGAGFTFVARQKRIQLDGDDFKSISCSTTGGSNGWRSSS
uniref:PDDEXK nuclease domain-containing protein n=1 Tax=Granulicella arctica TaxID=940613 RepID=UPI0037C0AFF5